ncbi:cobalamin biosynthesis protein [Methanocaldococcus villosus KIN24-T80]|uniref:Probable cobalamin biosynthesis protein CobD n=1 Tax=Methanocaldococcus villosus KIN24-T80 TaxID=1069083 RepID=N6VR67_9EURY|nr:adenosylcobinamide-phosphate synthase CbiB [Methanocaldococcus villosus]ENN96400.1 cobalamin biosynthesis protein [Methanocaldococcus villosus KIN24-T80]
MINPIILYITIIVDVIFGEPNEKVHPTVLIGRLISLLERLLPSTYSNNKIRDFLFGSVVTVTTILIVGYISYIVEKLILALPKHLSYLLYAILLSTTIGYRSLKEFCIKPIEALIEGDLEKARELVKHVVSRNTEDLDKEHILSASIESLSENLTDSVISPLFYAIFFGLVGAFIYRTVNTLDAMIGYKNSKYYYYGKLAARLDDILNFIPSKISGLLLIITAPFYGGDWKRALYGFLFESLKTPSPNSGFTMATLANALNMSLEKIGYYKLGNGRIDIDKSLRAFKAIDYSIIAFLLIYTLLWWLFEGFH